MANIKPRQEFNGQNGLFHSFSKKLSNKKNYMYVQLVCNNYKNKLILYKNSNEKEVMRTSPKNSYENNVGMSCVHISS
jgi:hypothetical protein